jgi:hypothetical protein
VKDEPSLSTDSTTLRPILSTVALPENSEVEAKPAADETKIGDEFVDKTTLSPQTEQQDGEVSSDAAIDSERTTTIPSFQQPAVESQITSEKPIDAQVDESEDKVSSDDSGDAATTFSPLSVDTSSYSSSTTTTTEPSAPTIYDANAPASSDDANVLDSSYDSTSPVHQSPQLMLPLRFPLMIVAPPPLQGLLLILPPKLQPSIPSHQSQS